MIRWNRKRASGFLIFEPELAGGYPHSMRREWPEALECVMDS